MNLLQTALALLFSQLAFADSASSIGYGCNVDYCQSCSAPNFCGLCNTNYILMINQTNSMPYCSLVSCNIQNCNICYQANKCSQCASQYAITSDSTCAVASGTPIACPSSCLACTSTTQCTVCAYGYNIQNGYCLPNNGALVPNCMATFTGFSCQVCKSNYVVSSAYQCTAQSSISCVVPNCQFCEANDACSQCSYGFQVNETDGSCYSLPCDVVNCAQCEDNNQTMCGDCKPSYYLNEAQNLCVPKYPGCNVQNCIACAEDAETCSICEKGFTAIATNAGSFCQVISGSMIYQLNTSSIYYYPVSNCAQYGSLIPGTTILTVGCITCSDGFVNSAGYCVANLTLSNYTCDIQNCVYCTQNNYCGQCADGYIVFMGSYQKCIPTYSPYQYCAITGLFVSSCAQCNEGYTLNTDYQCIRYWSSSNCAVIGCEYCLTQNQCAVCRDGYTLNGNSCQAECSIQNCYTCSNDMTCQTCNYGYSLVNNSKTCQFTSSIAKDDCTTFDAQCTTCNQLQCTACAQNYTLNGNTCCATPARNVYGCQVYESVCSNVCIQCSIGFNIVQIPFFNFSTQCLNVYCSISNCAYCYGSSNACLVCMENFTVTASGTCTPYTPTPSCNRQNCQICNSDGTCNTCLSGYHLYNGACVCPFQNCLKCMGSSYCSICAYPMVAPVLTSAGCLPEVVPASNCMVPNCVQCQNSWYCAVCSPGFSLVANGTCVQNLCDSSTNCQLCSTNNQECFLCKTGTYQSGLFSKQCNSVPADYACFVDGCSICETSTTCSKCYDMFYLGTDSLCHKTVCSDNCLLCYANNTCSICVNGFYRSLVNNNLECLPLQTTSNNCSTIDQCINCQKNTAGTLQCLSCYPGFMPNTDKTSCVPQDCQISNCQLCMPSNQKLCLTCTQGYYLNPYYQCVPFNPTLAVATCDIYNCQFCGLNDKCAVCLIEWNTTSEGVCVSEKYCDVTNCGNCTSPTVCYSCDTNYLFTSTNVCTPNCNITNCNVCSSFTECSVCAGDLVPSNGQCLCRDTYISTGSTTCGCPDNFTPSNNVCYNCTTPGNCSVCSSTNVCNTCIDNTFIVKDGSCVCPDDTFTFTNNTCECLNDTKVYDNTCVPCSVQNCQTCSSQDICIKCVNNLTLMNSTTCGCLDTFEESDESYCVCENSDAKTNINKDVCYTCTNVYCDFCKSENVCEQCQTNFTLMDNGASCQCQTGQTPFNGYCYTCSSTLLPYCTTCNATNFCQTCMNTFTNVNGTCVCAVGYRRSGLTCIECNIDNCDVCTTVNQCTNCLTGYSQFSVSICMLCNIENCASCSSPNFCASCNNGLAVNSLGNMCVTCNVANCQSCSANGVCSDCLSGYFFGVNNRTCVSCSVSGCNVCSQNDVCSTCLTGYVVSSGSCNLCAYPCATCNTNGGCVTCQSPYSLNAATNGSCYTCNTINCQSCLQSNTLTCSQCNSLYTLNQSNVCTYQCLDINCKTCQFNQVCTVCSLGYAPNGSTGCNQCTGAPACIQCSATDLNTCYKCGDGYYAVNGICNTCPYSYCKTCNAQGCLTFRQSTGFIAVTINNTVYPATCDPSCSACSSSNPSTCQTCKSGYAFKSGICIPCASNCKTCGNTNANQCLTCFSNANLVNSQCIVCTGSCLTCLSTNDASCTSCPIGFFLSGTTCISGCPNLCKTCSNATFCTACQSGYSVTSNGTCLPCLSTCRQCSGSQQGLCLSCGTGFYSSQNKCTVCPGNCTSCNFAGCIQCDTGFTLTSSFQCAPNCLPPCATCSATDATVCSSCILGYNFNQNTGNCDPAPACSGGICYFCPFGTILSNNQCEDCNATSNCARCSASNLSECTSCMSGLFLNTASGSCQTCPSGCATCSTASACLTCSFGYVATQQVVPSSIQCQACLPPCQTCTQTTQTCTSCITGYALNGWKCLSTFNLGFSTELDTTLTIFYNNYNAYLLAIANAFGSTNVGLVTMTSIVQGSVNAAGNVTITDQSNSANGYNNLNKLMANGSTIAGMGIISSTVTVNGGEIDDNSGGPNLALILGICIPVGVILIGVLVYFLCIRKKNNSPPVNYTVNNGVPNTTVRQTFELTREQPDL